MNNKEHSILLYLLDALISAPHKFKLLLKMAKQSSLIESEDFVIILNRLNACNKKNNCKRM